MDEDGGEIHDHRSVCCYEYCQLVVKSRAGYIIHGRGVSGKGFWCRADLILIG